MAATPPPGAIDPTPFATLDGFTYVLAMYGPAPGEPIHHALLVKDATGAPHAHVTVNLAGLAGDEVAIKVGEGVEPYVEALVSAGYLAAEPHRTLSVAPVEATVREVSPRLTVVLLSAAGDFPVYRMMPTLLAIAAEAAQTLKAAMMDGPRSRRRRSPSAGGA